MLFEICVEGVDGAVAGERGGGGRIELCASLVEGGITPSPGTVRATVGAVRVPVMVMVRPRGGDFLYSALEFASMRDDVVALRSSGAAGVVFGCLTSDGRIDEARTRELVAAARPLSVTVHRAFDMTDDPASALEALIRCGVNRVLTSGQAADAIEGVPVLKQLVAQAAGRIVILGCGALRPDTIGTVVRETGLSELHFSARAWAPSAMHFRNARLTMGGAAAEREYQALTTDVELVRATIAAARA
jgi:copper homeostasis protein